MKLIDADVLKDGIAETRAAYRACFKSGQMNYKMYIVVNHILDIFEETIDIMPECNKNEKEGDKNDFIPF